MTALLLACQQSSQDLHKPIGHKALYVGTHVGSRYMYMSAFCRIQEVRMQPWMS